MAFELPGNIEVIGAFYQANALMVSEEESEKLESNAINGKPAFDGFDGLRERLLGDRPDIQGFFMDGKKPLFRIRTMGCIRFERHFVKVSHPTGVFKWALPEGSSARNLRSKLSG